MLKRLPSVIMVLGLTLMAAIPVAADVTSEPGDIIGPFDYSTGQLKGVPFPAMDDLDRSDLVVFTGEVTPFAKPADICADERARGQGQYIAGAIYPGAIYWVYQDTETVCASPYTFQVVSAHFYAVSSGVEGKCALRAEVWSVDDTDPACPVPDAVVWTGPTRDYSVPAGEQGLLLEIPLSASPYDYACVDGPYFIAAVCVSQDAGVELGPWASDYVTPPYFCTWYWNVPTGQPTDWSEDWYDPDEGDCLDLNLFSDGRASGENDCHQPGVCRWDWMHCVGETHTYYSFYLPSSSGTRDYIWQQWIAAAPCTVWQVDQYMGGVASGDPGLRISIYDDNNGFPGSEIAYEEFTTAQIPAGGFVSATFPAFAPVVIPVGRYYVFMGCASRAGDGDTVYVGVDDAPMCPLTPTCFTGFRDPLGNNVLACDYYGPGLEFELFCELYTCCVGPPPICDPSPDNWFTHAHDYGRTSRSTIAVGDPCNINLAWKANTTRGEIQFTNVSVYGGKVYASDNEALHCFDLATGALEWTYGPGVPTTGTSMRGNPTISGGYVYSGGGFHSFFCLDTLGILKWSRHFDSHGGGVTDQLCGYQRFGVSLVVTIGDDEVIIFGDQGSCLWALNTADGTNYAGWPTNPVTLPWGDEVFHSPAYDGGNNLYVATLYGWIYQVDLATGNMNWQFEAPHDGHFYSGCSYDVNEDMVYSASRGNTPMRFKIDAHGNPVWMHEQGNVLYSPPTIGDRYVYIAQDYPNTGLLIVNKETGVEEYNFNADGVGMVTNPVALTCEGYLFAGDREGRWHLLDARTLTRVWSRQFDDYVWGTALAYHELEDRNFAVMSIWSDICTGHEHGGIFCWELDGSPRPMMEQLAFDAQVNVPLGSTMAYDEVVPDVFMNRSYCADLTILSATPGDYPPSTAASMTPKITKVSRANAKAAEKTVDGMVTADYLSFFDEEGNLTKRGLMAGKASLPAGPVDFEAAVDRHRSKARFEKSKKRATSLAAAAAILRTQNVRPEGGSTFPATYGNLNAGGFMFDYDGTGLERRVDHEYIEWTHDDPDFFPEDNSGTCHQRVYGHALPYLDIAYVGGCPFEWYEDMRFGCWDYDCHEEQVSTFGAFGDGSGYGLDWRDGINDAPIYDAGFFILQEGGDYFQADFYDWEHRFLADPAPISGACGFDLAWDVPFGRSMVLDCPEGGPNWPELNVDYIDLLGEYTITSFIDTVESESDAIGIKVYQLEIGFHDFGSGYGDLKLYHYKVKNRDDVPKEDLIAGMFFDWDVGDATSNAAALVPEVGGVAVWDSVDPSVAFGHLVMPGYMSTDNSCEVTGVDFYALWGIVNHYNIYATTCIPCCLNPSHAGTPQEQSVVVDCFTSYWPGSGHDPNPGNDGDRASMFAWPQFNLGEEGEAHLYAALIGVDATPNERAAINDEIRGMAYRANKISGFARGDVNDDGCIDASDLAYLYAWLNGAQIPIFPYEDFESTCGGNGDVNLSGITDVADVFYLLDYLMRTGPAPRGAWRFGIMP